MRDSTDFPSNFFADASEALLRLMEELGSEQVLEQDEILMTQGDDGDSLHIVLSGSFEISVISSEGRKLSLNVAQRNDVLGEIALFDPGPRTATVRARERSRVRSVRNADVMDALNRSPELGAELISLAGRRMRWMSNQLNDQVFLPLPTRLARKVMHLTARNTNAQPVLPLSQLELAEFIGASREAVSKTLSAWARAGHIKLTRGALQVLDRDALEKIADFTLY